MMDSHEKVHGLSDHLREVVKQGETVQRQAGSVMSSRCHTVSGFSVVELSHMKFELSFSSQCNHTVFQVWYPC